MEVKLTELKRAIKELNDCGILEGILDKKLAVIGSFDTLKEKFMEAVEIIPEEKEVDLPDLVIEIYNALVEMEEEGNMETEVGTKEEEVKEEKAEVEKKEVTKEKKTRFKKGSRPHMLYMKALEGKTLDRLLEDEELLKKYKNHKAWIRNDYKRIFGE